MLVQAGLDHKSTAEIAAAYEAAFHDDEALVNILPALVFPRATEHIPEMLDLAERLEDAGHAYRTDHDNVYYEVATFDGYGKLSGNSLDDLRAGHGPGQVEHDKRDPADSRYGRQRANSAHSSGRRAGARVSRAGISSARRWPSSTSASGSTSIPAVLTTSSRTTRTRSRSPRRW